MSDIHEGGQNQVGDGLHIISMTIDGQGREGLFYDLFMDHLGNAWVCIEAGPAGVSRWRRFCVEQSADGGER